MAVAKKVHYASRFCGNNRPDALLTFRREEVTCLVCLDTLNRIRAVFSRESTAPALQPRSHAVIHIKAEICLLNGPEDDITVPADDDWLDAARASVRHGGMLVLRVDNSPGDGSTGKVALTLGPTAVALGVPGTEDDYLEFGTEAEAPRLFGFLLDAAKLAELIAILKMMQDNFPPPEDP